MTTTSPFPSRPHPRQIAPLDQQDRAIVMAFPTGANPSHQNLIDAARLLLRYEGAQASADLYELITSAIAAWGLDRESLFAKTRALWNSGWQPSASLEPQTSGVGSGADVEG